MLYAEIRLQLRYLKDNAHIVGEAINAQEYEVSNILSLVNTGYIISWNLKESPHFKNLVKYRRKELGIINGFQKASRKEDIMKLFYNASDIIERNKGVTAIQTTITPFPIATSIQTYGLVNYGLEFLPIFFVIGELMKWSPTITAVLKRKFFGGII